MHILFITDNFIPESNAPASRVYEHSKVWVQKGAKVTVITCAPNFPEGKVFDGYKNNWLKKEKIDGIHVWRVKTYITKNQGFLRRTLDFMSFMISSFIFGLFVKKADVVIGTSPQFFTMISAWALAKVKNAKFIFELRDIWPASIYAVGVMKKNAILRFIEKIEIFLYHQANIIISVTHSFKEELVNRGIDSKKIHIIENGSDPIRFFPFKRKDKFFLDKYDLNQKFIIGYIGTHGLAHALDNVLEAAQLLKVDDNIRIILAGGGADRARIERLVKVNNLDNVIMINSQPKDLVPKLWSICDTSLVHLRNAKLFKTVIPSKIFESMAMGVPILYSAPYGEAANIITDNELGLFVRPEDPQQLANKIMKLKNDTSRLLVYSENCIKTSKKYNRNLLAASMLELIKNNLRQ